jgi:phospholipid N-methyltransferase
MVIKMIKFFKEFIKNPKDIGALLPSSSYLAEGILKEIEFDICDCIIELGAGTGIFTEKIISRKKEETMFLVFEKNKY